MNEKKNCQIRMNEKVPVIKNINDMESFQKICAGRHIFFYGAGKRADGMLKIFEYYRLQVYGFIVSALDKNPAVKAGLPVCEAAIFHDPDSIIVFAVSVKDRIEQIIEIIPQALDEVYYFEDALYFDIYYEVFQKTAPYKMKSLRVDAAEGNVEAKYARAVSEGLLFRIPPSLSDDQNMKRLIDKLSGKSIRNEFEKEYGSFRFLKKSKGAESDRKNTLKVYMACCHTDKIQVENLDDWIIPVQAGAALTEKKICEKRDDQGDQISLRNRDYSEGTVIYWMWKNAPTTEYIGLCHYRRHFDIRKEDLDIISEYDIVVTIPTITVDNWSCFSEFVRTEDLNLTIQAVKKLFPEYMDAADRFFKSSFLPPANLFIMKYRIFQEYADFLFGITEYIYQYYKSRNIIRNDRYMGYIMENLLGIFLVQNHDRYKICYTDMKFIS